MPAPGDNPAAQPAAGPAVILPLHPPPARVPEGAAGHPALCLLAGVCS